MKMSVGLISVFGQCVASDFGTRCSSISGSLPFLHIKLEEKQIGNRGTVRLLI